MLLVSISAVALLLAAACQDSGGSPGPIATSFPQENESPEALVTPVTPAPRPVGISETARPVTQTTNLGRIVRQAGAAPQAVMARVLNAASCVDGVVTLDTSGETIYMLLANSDCASFWDDQTTALFLNQQSAFSLQATETRFRVVIETLEGAQAEFTASGVWVE